MPLPTPNRPQLPSRLYEVDCGFIASPAHQKLCSEGRSRQNRVSPLQDASGPGTMMGILRLWKIRADRQLGERGAAKAKDGTEAEAEAE